VSRSSHTETADVLTLQPVHQQLLVDRAHSTPSEPLLLFFIQRYSRVFSRARVYVEFPERGGRPPGIDAKSAGLLGDRCVTG